MSRITATAWGMIKIWDKRGKKNGKISSVKRSKPTVISR